MKDIIKNINKYKMEIMFIFIIIIIMIVLKLLMDKNIIENFREINKKKSLILFYVDWCSHCKSILPIWNKFELENNNKRDVKVSKINCDQNADLARKYNIERFPTILYLENEMVKKIYNGDRTLKSLTDFLVNI